MTIRTRDHVTNLHIKRVAAGVTAFILAMAGWAVCIVWGWPKP